METEKRGTEVRSAMPTLLNDVIMRIEAMH